jgi:hypothetical protein
VSPILVVLEVSVPLEVLSVLLMSPPGIIFSLSRDYGDAKATALSFSECTRLVVIEAGAVTSHVRLRDSNKLF